MAINSFCRRAHKFAADMAAIMLNMGLPTIKSLLRHGDTLKCAHHSVFSFFFSFFFYFSVVF